jgi:hypothetical protein
MFDPDVVYYLLYLIFNDIVFRMTYNYIKLDTDQNVFSSRLMDYLDSLEINLR